MTYRVSFLPKITGGRRPKSEVCASAREALTLVRARLADGCHVTVEDRAGDRLSVATLVKLADDLG